MGLTGSVSVLLGVAGVPSVCFLSSSLVFCLLPCSPLLSLALSQCLSLGVCLASFLSNLLCFSWKLCLPRYLPLGMLVCYPLNLLFLLLPLGSLTPPIWVPCPAPPFWIPWPCPALHP